ncbi:MAG: sodium/pantothenate symporter [Shewanellaceae bacterium]|nr:sodium/pantothenate symporter [Shewanellaceae bacterium]
MIESWLALLGYFVITLGMARWLAWREGGQAQTPAAFYLGNRFLNAPALALTVVATYASASTFVGGPGAAFHYGLSWVWLALIQMPVAMLTIGLLGQKFLQTRPPQVVTLVGWLDHQFKHAGIRWLASASILCGFIAMMSVQLIGGARMLEGVVGVPYGVGLGVFGGLVACYTYTGGFRSVVLTDVFQACCMLVGILLILAGLLVDLGGLTAAVEILQIHQPVLLTPDSGGQISWPFLLSFWILVGFGTLGLPHTVMRLMVMQDSRTQQRAIIWGTLLSFIFIFVPHMIGVLGQAYVVQHDVELSAPDEIMPFLIAALFDPVTATLLMAAPLAAVLSSVDSMLLQTSATLVRDVLKTQIPMSATTELRCAKLAILVIAMIALLLAWQPPAMLVWMNLLAFGALQAVFLWPVVLSCWLDIKATAVFQAMVLGLSSYLLLAYMDWRPGQMHPIVLSLCISGLPIAWDGIKLYWEQKKWRRTYGTR